MLLFKRDARLLLIVCSLTFLFAVKNCFFCIAGGGERDLQLFSFIFTTEGVYNNNLFSFCSVLLPLFSNNYDFFFGKISLAPGNSWATLGT